MAPQIPPLLSPYLSLPPETSLILLTHVLGASTNWLVLRYLYSALSPTISSHDESPSDMAISDDAPTKVLLVSFMRDLAWWRDSARKLGLDLGKLAKAGRFAFVDGVRGLFVPLPTSMMAATGSASAGLAGQVVGADRVLSDAGLESIRKELLRALQDLGSGEGGKGRIVLVVDQLDFLLAAGEDDVTAVALGELLLELRSHVHSTVLTLAADSPLVSAQHTPLEVNHAAFLLSVAHQARYVLGVRLLDTGTARDVSGVMRVTTGGGEGEHDEDLKGTESGGDADGREYLYYVGGDGGVKVFERGQ